MCEVRRQKQKVGIRLPRKTRAIGKLNLFNKTVGESNRPGKSYTINPTRISNFNELLCHCVVSCSSTIGMQLWIMQLKQQQNKNIGI